MFVLSSPVHAIYLVLLEQPFEIFSWQHWGRLFEGLPASAKKVCLKARGCPQRLRPQCTVPVCTHA